MSGASTADILNVALRLCLGAAIVYIVMRLVRKMEEKKHAPESVVSAVVASKRVDCKMSPLYCIAFDLEDGQQLELSVSEEVYHLCIPGDQGSLTYRGNEFIRFERIQKT